MLQDVADLSFFVCSEIGHRKNWQKLINTVITKYRRKEVFTESNKLEALQDLEFIFLLNKQKCNLRYWDVRIYSNCTKLRVLFLCFSIIMIMVTSSKRL